MEKIRYFFGRTRLRLHYMLRQKISNFIARTCGTINFIRMIEWREMLRLLQAKNGEKILDVACGSGALSRQIARKGAEVYGIDLSPDYIKMANFVVAGSNCHLAIGDAEKLPYANEFFDKLVCSSSLEHFQNDEKALQEMSRVLKPNGIVVLTTDSLSYPIKNASLKERHQKQYGVVSYYTLADISNKLARCGLAVVAAQYLFNSWLTSCFYQLSIKAHNKFLFRIAVIFFSYFLIPLFLISDKLFGKKNCGYTLIVKGKKK